MHANIQHQHLRKVFIPWKWSVYSRIMYPLGVVEGGIQSEGVVEARETIHY
jgi:hypothetical protein